ncbi:MAG: 3-dehydroquinate synthase [Phycisphaerae bacterium]|nr:3-dehydroquinate synthase [Phycisphaerae bacterium]
MTIQKKVEVDLSERSYEVRVGAGLLDSLGAVAAAIQRARQAVVISDSNVAGLYGRQAIGSLEKVGLAATLIDFPAGETNKTLTTYSHVMDELFAAEPPIDRDTLVVALGGGVVGDLAGFVAATALRGLRFVQCPTTLLADVDASVGGKTAVDHPAGKNLIGAFHQPCGVLIDVDLLGTLPKDALSAGLAECVKHGVIRDDSLLDFIEGGVSKIMAGDADMLAELIGRNVAIKAAVVVADEREASERAHLNFGHTVGHAVETAAGYGVVSHGQAVALGMVAAFHIAESRSLIDSAAADRIRKILVGLSLPVGFDDLPDLPADARDPDRLREIMAHDKKALGGVIRFILPTALGSVAIFDDVTDEQIKTAIAAL